MFEQVCKLSVGRASTNTHTNTHEPKQTAKFTHKNIQPHTHTHTHTHSHPEKQTQSERDGRTQKHKNTLTDTQTQAQANTLLQLYIKWPKIKGPVKIYSVPRPGFGKIFLKKVFTPFFKSKKVFASFF